MASYEDEIARLVAEGDAIGLLELGKKKIAETNSILEKVERKKKGKSKMDDPLGIMPKLSRKSRQRTKNFKKGRFRRLDRQTEKSKKPGFGNENWSGNKDWYLVEFVNEDDEQNRTTEITNYIACREFTPEQREFFRKYIAKGGMNLQEGETVQSQYVLNYVFIYLHTNYKELDINMAFIYNVQKEGSNPAGLPLYTVELVPDSQLGYNDRMMANLRNNIYHPEA